MRKLNLEIDDEVMEYNIPENWADLTVKQFMDLYRQSIEDKDDLQRSVYIASTILGIDEDIIYMFDTDSFNEIISSLEFISKTEITAQPKDFVVINNEEYYLKKDYSKLTVGEIISIDTIISQSHNNNPYTQMDKLLCIFLRKKKDNGKLEQFKPEFMNRAKLFETLSIEDVYNVVGFFSSGRTL
jgi:hypothetical protein